MSKRVTPSPVKILLVDDKTANLDTLEAVLRSPRHDLHRAEGGMQALKMLLENEYACCLLDIRMPEVDGFQTAEIIRQDPLLEHLPIIFVSAEVSDQSSMFQGYEKGAVDFLIKPLEPFVLKSKVRVFVDLYLQRKALERTEEIEKLNIQLESVNKDLEHFTHMASHDLKEPARKQLNLVQLLQLELGTSLSESAGLLLKEIGRSSVQIMDIVKSFRVLTDVEGIGMERTSVDLKQLIERCLSLYQDTLAQRKIQIHFDPFPPSLSLCSLLVERLYENMIVNALDHVHTEGFSLAFTAEKTNPGNWIFGVKNTGSTVPQGQLENIFKMYRSFDPKGQKASGIGLAICKKVVDRHQGTLVAESGVDFVHFKFSLGDT